MAVGMIANRYCQKREEKEIITSTHSMLHYINNKVKNQLNT